MDNPFFDHPILNSPYEYPKRYWELDSQGQPTQRIIEDRRRADFITPIPKPKKRKGSLVSSKSSLTKVRDYQHRSSSTISPRLSTEFAKKLTSGEVTNAGPSHGRNRSAGPALAPP
jgi:hypothetical protein